MATLRAQQLEAVLSKSHQPAVGTHHSVILALLVAFGLGLLLACLMIWTRPPPRRTDQDNDPGLGGGGGGGGGGMGGPGPGGGAGSWPEFEQQFAEHVESPDRSKHPLGVERPRIAA